MGGRTQEALSRRMRTKSSQAPAKHITNAPLAFPGSRTHTHWQKAQAHTRTQAHTNTGADKAEVHTHLQKAQAHTNTGADRHK
jgi:hypothetical protein